MKTNTLEVGDIVQVTNSKRAYPFFVESLDGAGEGYIWLRRYYEVENDDDDFCSYRVKPENLTLIEKGRKT